MWLSGEPRSFQNTMQWYSSKERASWHRQSALISGGAKSLTNQCLLLLVAVCLSAIKGSLIQQQQHTHTQTHKRAAVWRFFGRIYNDYIHHLIAIQRLGEMYTSKYKMAYGLFLGFKRLWTLCLFERSHCELIFRLVRFCKTGPWHHPHSVFSGKMA